MPPGAAVELRCAGVNLDERAFFQFAFAVSVMGIGHIALISHDDCAMVGLAAKRQAFARGLAERGGWEEAAADAFFGEQAGSWQQDDAIATVVRHAGELRERLAPVRFAPLHYSTGEGTLYQINEHDPS